MRLGLLFLFLLAAAPAHAQQSSPPPAAAAAPQSQGPVTSAAAEPVPSPVSMEPAQVRALLYKIYMSAFRVSDLLSVFQPQKLTMTDAERQAFGRRVDLLHADLQTLERSRGEFYNQPGDVTAGQATSKSIKAILPELDAFSGDVARHGDTADSQEYAKAAAELSKLQKSLEPYVVWLEAKAGLIPPQPVPPAVGLKTETITAPSEVPPLTAANSTQTGPGYMKPADVKALAYQIYAESYRVSDLLTILRPEGWKMADAERTDFNAQVDALRAARQELERWRGQLDKQPDSMYLAYQTYAALNALWPRVDAVGQLVAKYENANLGAQYETSRKALFDSEQKLSGYVAYLIGNQHQSVAALEDNLSRCQSNLGYAMLPRREHAVPMKNVLPVFKGHRRVRKTKKSAEESTKAHEGKAAGSQAASAH